MAELQDLAALVRANTPLIVIETPDEARVVDLFKHLLVDVWRALYRWSITEGLRRMDMDREDPPEGAPDASNTLRDIAAHTQRGIYLLLDFDPYLTYAGTQRQLRDILARRNCCEHTIVLVGTRIELPTEFEPLAVRFALRMPTRMRSPRWCATKRRRTCARTAGAGSRSTRMRSRRSCTTCADCR